MSHSTDWKTDWKADWNRHLVLLLLPPELRNKIYEHCLFVGEVQLVNLARKRIPPSPPIGLNLLRTCRQIRNEAEAIFYTTNQLFISENDLFQSVHRSLYRTVPTPTNLRFIKELIVEVGPPVIISTLLDHASKVPNLRVLNIHVLSTVSRNSHHDPYQTGRDIVSIDKDCVQWWINKVPNIKVFGISTAHSQLWEKRLDEVETLVQAMIEYRDVTATSRMVEL